jgi:hypothetical protein
MARLIARMRRRAAAAFVLALPLSCGGAGAETPPRPTVTAVEAVGGAFRFHFADGSVREREAAVGAVLVFEEDGRRRRVRIAATRPDPTPSAGGVLLHDFRDLATDEPLCDPGPDGTREGFAVPRRVVGPDGRTRIAPGGFEIACTAGALGKCVRFGYAPWRPERADLWLACIRMVRADYCGDDIATTRDGTLVDVYDDAGVQTPDLRPDQAFEAGWTPDGAVCVAHPRIAENITPSELERGCPRLAGRIGAAACDEATARAAGARLFVRSAPPKQ